MDDPTWREEFHGPGVTATVRCNWGRCLVEVLLERDHTQRVGQVQFEVLLQSRDQRGLPRGAPALVCAMQIPLRLRPDGKMLGGHGWLPPEMGAALVRRCHFRVTPC